MTTQTIDTQRIEAYLVEREKAHTVNVTDILPIEDLTTEFSPGLLPDVAWYVHATVTTFEFGKDHTVPMAFTIGEKDGSLYTSKGTQW